MNKEVNFSALQRFEKMGYKLKNAIDAGCHKGNWSKRCKNIYPDANIYLVDAVKHEGVEALGTFIEAALAQESEERVFYQAQNDLDSSGSTLYKDNSNVPFLDKKVITKKLIDVVPNIKYDWIKMDVQGAECEIIEGSLPLFKKTKFVQLECAVHNNNHGAPKFHEIINYMFNCNFKVFDIENIYYNNKLMCIDFIFNNKILPKIFPCEEDFIYYKQYN